MQPYHRILITVLFMTTFMACSEEKPAMRSQDPPGDIKSFDPVKTFDSVRIFADPEAELVSMVIEAYVNFDGTVDLTKNRFNEEIHPQVRTDMRAEYTFVRPFREDSIIDPDKLQGDTEGRIGERLITRPVSEKPPYPYQHVKIFIQHKLRERHHPYYNKSRTPGYSRFKDMLEYYPEGTETKGAVVPPPTAFAAMLQRSLQEAGTPANPSVRMRYDREGYSFTVCVDGPLEEYTAGSEKNLHMRYARWWKPAVTVRFDLKGKLLSIDRGKS